MKINHLIMAFLGCIAFLLFQCSEEDQPSSEELIQFTFQVGQPEIEGGRLKSLLDVRSALITLTSGTGTEIFKRKEVKIYQFGDGYVTEPLPLKAASYIITEFMLIDEDQKVLYATPVKGSALAKTVTKPLPIRFVVGKNSVKNIDMQVVGADTKSPEDFGYVSFGIDVMLSFQVSPFLTDNNTVSMTDALLQIFRDGYMVYSKELLPKANNILFKGDDEAEYSLVVSKHGYGYYTKKFTYKQLQQELNNMPLQVTFAPALLLTADISFYTDKHYSLYIGSEQDVTIDWGDGTRETKKGPVGHTYPYDGWFNITITQNLNKITELSIQSPTERVNVSQLSNMKSFGFYGFSGINSIDLSKNAKLVSVEVADAYSLETIIMPDEHNIRNMVIRNTMINDGLLSIVESLYWSFYLDEFDGESELGRFVFESYFDLPESVKPMLYELGSAGWEIYPPFEWEEPGNETEG